MNLNYFLILLSIAVIKSEGYKTSEEEYMDSVINLLLNGDNLEDNNILISEKDTPTDTPLFENGLWECGNCDVIDESRLIYSEVNNIETNTLEDYPYDVQVGLNLEGMQCVTVSSNVRPNVHVVSGHCAGAYVTLSVQSAEEFIVRVYGDNKGL